MSPGAHGTSHQFVSQEIAKLKAVTRADRLAPGATARPCRPSRTQADTDTSMGLTLEGLMISTCTGDIDPAVVFTCSAVAMSVDEVDTLSTRSPYEGHDR